MRLFFLSTLLLLITTCIYAQQEATLKLVIEDVDSKTELVGVVITLDGKNSATTDIAGNALLTIVAGKHLLQAGYIGYEKYIDTINLHGGENSLTLLMKSSSSQLEPVVISASKFQKKLSEETVSMNVLKPSLIQNTNSITMDEALNQVPGVNIIDGQANIRGGSGYSYGAGSRVLVMVDGIPQLTADAGDVKWDFLPVENLKQVEIIKGAASTLYGSSALNGVINIITDFPGSKPETEINLYQGIYENPKRHQLVWWGDRQPYFSGGYFSHKQRFGQFDLVLGGNLFNEQSFRQGVYNERGRVNANLRYRFKKIDGLSIGLNTNFMYQQTVTFFIWQNDSSGAYKPFGGVDTAGSSLTKEKESRFNIDPYFTLNRKNGSVHNLKARYFDTNNITQNGDNSEGKFNYIEYQYQHPFKFGLRLTTGIVANANKVISQLYGNHDGDNEVAYIQLDQKIKKLSIIGGVRYEIYRVDTFSGKSDPVFRAGANYELFKGNHIRASFGQGYRFPSIAEKYIKTTVGSITVFPNPTLQPEKGWSAEVGMQQGFKISSWVGYVDVAAFTQHLSHFMEFTFGPWGNPLTDPFFGLGFKSINLNQARINGLEATVFGQGKLFGCPVNLLGGVTLIQPINVDEMKRSDSLLSTNPHFDTYTHDSIYNLRYLKYRYTTTFKLDADITYKIFTFGINCRYNSFMLNIDPFLQIIPGIYEYRKEHDKGDIVFDAHVGVAISKTIRLAVIVKNLFNAEYTDRPALIEAPRNFTLQMQAKF